MIGELIDGVRGLGRKTLGYRARRLRQQRIAQLERSGLLDRQWYLETYPDVRDSGFDPARHYLESGWREGRDPGPTFSTKAYLSANPDVAQSGVNPLLHYVQHGRAEGRGTSDQGIPVQVAFETVEKFGPAAACADFQLPHRPLERWLRAGRIHGDTASLLKVAGMSIARLGDGPASDDVRSALAELGKLSGKSEWGGEERFEPASFDLTMLDAWHAGWSILRIRWTGRQGPVVVRAIQHVGADPQVVGEALVRDETSLLDLHLADPYFPLLFLFTDPQGSPLGTRFLTFPSLCRGGLHYPELLAIAQSDPGLRIDLAKVDAGLAIRLAALRRGADPLVSALTVKVEGAAGTQPLFQEDFKRWLRGVIRVSVDAGGSDDTPWDRYLTEAVAVDAGPARSNGRARLRLAPNMVPSISALVAAADRGQHSHAVTGSIILSADDPSSAATYVHVPPIAAEVLRHSTPNLPILEPDGASLPANLPVLALRCAMPIETNEAKLLLPTAAKSGSDKPDPITWLLSPNEWAMADLPQALEALRLQEDANARILFVGQPSPPVIVQASRMFERVETVRDVADAMRRVDTPLVGYVGAGIVLHDRRTLATLFEALSVPDVLSVSAPIVDVERRGEEWFSAPGETAGTSHTRALSSGLVPVPPPQHFWIARSTMLDWFNTEADGAPHAIHLSSADISVSRLGRQKAEPPLFWRFNPVHGAVRTEALFG